MRRSSIEVRVVDDGHGFEVGRALARAAQRGRLGIVGIGERVRMLGGSFEIDSAPGGPTMLTFILPRVIPDEPPPMRDEDYFDEELAADWGELQATPEPATTETRER